MDVATIEMLPEGSDAAVRVYRCNRCYRKMRATVWGTLNKVGSFRLRADGIRLLPLVGSRSCPCSAAISTTSVPAWEKSLGRLRGTYFSFDSPFFFKQFKKPTT